MTDLEKRMKEINEIFQDILVKSDGFSFRAKTHTEFNQMVANELARLPSDVHVVEIKNGKE